MAFERFINILITAQDFASNVFGQVQANADAFGEELGSIGDEFGSLGDTGGSALEDIGSSIAAATTQVFAMIAAFEALTGILRAVATQFDEAMDLQVERVRAQITAVKTLGLSYEDAAEYVQQAAQEIAILGAETPTSATDIQQIFLSIQDDYNLALRDQVGSLEELRQITTEAATRFALLGDNVDDVRAALIAYLSGSVGPGGLDIYRFFGDNPIVRTELIRLLEQEGINENEPGGAVDSFGDISLAQRVDFLNRVVEGALSDRDIEELGKTARSDLSNALDRVFDKEIGALSITRDLDPNVAGYQSVFEAFTQTLDILIGDQGIVSQFVRIFGLADLDVMEYFREAFLNFNQYLINFRDGLLGIQDLSAYELGRLIGNVIGDFIGAIRGFVLNLLSTFLENIPNIIGFSIGLLEGLLESLIVPTITDMAGFFFRTLMSLPRILWNTITTFGEILLVTITDIGGFILTPFRAIGDFLGNLFDFGGVQSIWDGAMNLIGGFFSAIADSFSNILFIAASFGVPFTRAALILKSIFDFIVNLFGGREEDLNAIGGENFTQAELDAYIAAQGKRQAAFVGNTGEVITPVENSTNDFFGGMLAGIASFFANLGPNLEQFNKDLDAANENAFASGEAFVDATIAFFQGIPGFFAQLGRQAQETYEVVEREVVAAPQRIADAWNTISTSVVEFFQDIPGNLTRFFSGIGQAIVDLITGDFLSNILSAVGGFFSGIGQAILNFVTPIAQAVGGFFVGLFQGLFILIKPILLNPVTTFIGGVVARLYELLREPVGNFFVAIGQGIASGAQAFGGAFNDYIIQPVAAFFADLFTGSLGQGIALLSEQIANFASDLFTSIIDNVTSFFEDPGAALERVFFGGETKQRREQRERSEAQGGGQQESPGFFESIGNFFGGLFGFGSAEGHTPVPIMQAIAEEMRAKPPGTDLVIANSSELIATPAMVRDIVGSAFSLGKASVANQGFISQKAIAMINSATAFSAASGLTPAGFNPQPLATGNTINFNLTPGTPQEIARQAIVIFEDMITNELDNRL